MTGFIAPPWPISSPFGMRVNPITGVRKRHNGTDYRAAAGTPIKSIAQGVVEAKGVNLDKRVGFGHWVRIRNYDGSRALYAHMQEASPLRAGAAVTHGTTVGDVGSTGASTGPHLHLEITVNGVHVDPAAYMAARPVPPPAPPKPPASKPTAGARRHVVRRGETLGGIAAKYGTTWQKLHAANRGIIGSNPNRIFAGQVLSIPAGGSAPRPPAQPRKTNAQIATEVLQGKWGNGAERKRRLEAAGYSYAAVQAEVNRRV